MIIIALVLLILTILTTSMAGQYQEHVGGMWLVIWSLLIGAVVSFFIPAFLILYIPYLLILAIWLIIEVCSIIYKLLRPVGSLLSRVIPDIGLFTYTPDTTANSKEENRKHWNK